MTYPKTLYHSVLLLDGKIIGWKTANYGWDTVEKALCNRQAVNLILTATREQLSVACESAVVNDTEENNAFFDDKAFFERFPIHEDYPDFMFRPY